MILKKSYYLSDTFRKEIEQTLGTYDLTKIPSFELHNAIEKVLLGKYVSKTPYGSYKFSGWTVSEGDTFNADIVLAIILAIARNPGKYNEKELRNVHGYQHTLRKQASNKTMISILARNMIAHGMLEMR